MTARPIVPFEGWGAGANWDSVMQDFRNLRDVCEAEATKRGCRSVCGGL
jgi:hypothetical protein